MENRNHESENLDILLETSTIKQESVLSNLRAIDTKASIILAFFGVLLIPSIEIFRWATKTELYFYLKLFPGISVLCGIIFCLIILFPQNSIAFPNLSVLTEMYKKGIIPNNLKAELISYYRSATEKNRNLAQRKLKYTKFALILLIISISLIIANLILKGANNV